MYRLVVTGADSQALTDSSRSVPVADYASAEEAKAIAKEYETGWVKLGFHLTPAGIFVRGWEWRSAMIVSSEGGRPFRADGKVI